MTEEKSPMKHLLQTMPQVGRVEWIGVRPVRGGEMRIVKQVAASSESGLAGDRFDRAKTRVRQVTLIQQEHLAAVASILGRPAISPTLTRRNIVVAGINLLALKDRRFQIGAAILEGTGLCQPCSRMEQNLGAGGYNAMRGHGGITARILQDGLISVGNEVKCLTTE